MRQLATAERIYRFIDELGRVASTQSTMYLAGGATAVLIGWRESTIDADIKLVPETDELLRAIPSRGLVTTQQILEYFEEIRPSLYRFPAVDPSAFEERVRSFAAE